MKLYLQMFVKEAKPIENYSPYEVRQFLIKVLTVKEWAHAEKYVGRQDSEVAYCNVNLRPNERLISRLC